MCKIHSDYSKVLESFYFDSSNQEYVISASVALTLAIGLFIFNRQSVNSAKKKAEKNQMSKKNWISLPLTTRIKISFN